MPATLVDDVHRTACAVLERGVESLGPAPAPRPLLRLPERPREPHGLPGVEAALYEPEREKFGGEAGLERCHRVFAASSALAVRRLAAAGGPLPARERAALCAALMRQVARELELDTRSFWALQVRHWTGGEGTRRAVERLPGVLGDRRPHRRRRRRVRRPRGRRGGGDRALVQRGRTAEHYAFHLIHLMNNRLGLAGLEEAYVAHQLALRAPDSSTPLVVHTAEPMPFVVI